MFQAGKILRLVPFTLGSAPKAWFSSYRPNRGNYMENQPICRHQLFPGDLTQSSGIAPGLFSLAIVSCRIVLCVVSCRIVLWYWFEGRILIQSLAQPCDSQWRKRPRPQIVHSTIELHTVSIYRTKSPTKWILHFCLYLVTKNVMLIWHLSLKWQKMTSQTNIAN